jgi:hypothetical protein
MPGNFQLERYRVLLMASSGSYHAFDFESQRIRTRLPPSRAIARGCLYLIALVQCVVFNRFSTCYENIFSRGMFLEFVFK